MNEKSNTTAQGASSAHVRIRNTGTRRVVIGRNPKDPDSRFIKLGTDADQVEKISAEKRMPNVAELKGEEASRVRGSKVFEALKSRLGLQVA